MWAEHSDSVPIIKYDTFDGVWHSCFVIKRKTFAASLYIMASLFALEKDNHLAQDRHREVYVEMKLAARLAACPPAPVKPLDNCFLSTFYLNFWAKPLLNIAHPWQLQEVVIIMTWEVLKLWNNLSYSKPQRQGRMKDLFHFAVVFNPYTWDLYSYFSR